MSSYRITIACMEEQLLNIPCMEQPAAVEWSPEQPQRLPPSTRISTLGKQLEQEEQPAAPVRTTAVRDTVISIRIAATTCISIQPSTRPPPDIRSIMVPLSPSQLRLQCNQVCLHIQINFLHMFLCVFIIVRGLKYILHSIYYTKIGFVPQIKFCTLLLKSF